MRTLNEQFYDAIEAIKTDSYTSHPRGFQVKEILNYNITLENPRDRIVTFEARNTQKRYLLAEFIWYVSGSNDPEIIASYAPFWRSITNDDGTVNSGYGNRIFGASDLYPFNQWEKVKEILIKDKDSRQGVMRINHAHDYTYNNKDVPCTLSLQFFIRDNALHLITNMRSNDLWLGAVNDIFQFTMLQEMMMLQLKETYPELTLGKYYHNAASMHLYTKEYYRLETDPMDSIMDELSPSPIIMYEMTLLPTDIQNLVKMEEFWRIDGKKKDFDFSILEAYNELSPYWKLLVQVCFGNGELENLNKQHINVI